jgi:amidase
MRPGGLPLTHRLPLYRPYAEGNLSRANGFPYDVSRNDGQPTTLAQYLEALHRRDQSIIAWEQFFQAWDVLLCPASMVTAFPHCKTGSPLHVDGQDVAYGMVSAHGFVFNYTGHPAVMLPYKLDRDGLPIGVQMVGKRWDESRLLAIAKALTEVTGEFQRPPGY